MSNNYNTFRYAEKIPPDRKYYDYFCDLENEEDTINGEELKQLWNICFRYCKAFSVTFWNASETTNYYTEFKNNALNMYRTHSWPGTTAYGATVDPYVAVLPCNEKTKELIFAVSDNLLEFVYWWGYNNPEDPAFYRQDGTVFFESTIHDGGFHLSVDKDEDISELLLNRNWKQRQHCDFDDIIWFK